MVTNLSSGIVEIEGYKFINVTDQATELFNKGFDLFEITEENGQRTEHFIASIEELQFLQENNISIYKEEIR